LVGPNLGEERRRLGRDFLDSEEGPENPVEKYSTIVLRTKGGRLKTEDQI